MDVRYFLSILASRLIQAGARLGLLSAQISGIYLIGPYLGFPFFLLGNSLVLMGNDLYSTAYNFEGWLWDVERRLSQVVDLGGLQNYANRLIDFILNPTPLIFGVLRRLYPRLDALVDSTYSFIKPYVISIVREVFGYVSDIAGTVIRIIGELIPEFSILRSNPVQWVLDRLSAYSRNITLFLRDPVGWLKDQIRILFPDIWRFLQSPRDYLLDRLVEGLETIGERYLPRLLKVVENFIRLIF